MRLEDNEMVDLVGEGILLLSLDVLMSKRSVMSSAEIYLTLGTCPIYTLH